IPGVTLPAGTVAVPLECSTLPDGEIVGFPINNGNGSQGGGSNSRGSQGRDMQLIGATVTLPIGTTIVPGGTFPAGRTVSSVPGIDLRPGEVVVLLPGDTLPAGATVLAGVTVPAGSVTVTTPGITLPTGTVAVPLQCAILPDGTVIGMPGNGSA